MYSPKANTATHWARTLPPLPDLIVSHRSPKSTTPESPSYPQSTRTETVEIYRDSVSSDSDVEVVLSKPTFLSLPRKQDISSWDQYRINGITMDRTKSSQDGLDSLHSVYDALSPLTTRSSVSSAGQNDYFGLNKHDEEEKREIYRPAQVDELEDGKKKTWKGRVLMDPAQSAHLNALWELTYFPTTAAREEVAKASGLTPRQVQVWFQNQRQKQRRVLHDPTATEEEKAKLGDLRHSPRTRRKMTLHAETNGEGIVFRGATPPQARQDFEHRSNSLFAFHVPESSDRRPSLGRSSYTAYPPLGVKAAPRSAPSLPRHHSEHFNNFSFPQIKEWDAGYRPVQTSQLGLLDLEDNRRPSLGRPYICERSVSTPSAPTKRKRDDEDEDMDAQPAYKTSRIEDRLSVPLASIRESSYPALDRRPSLANLLDSRDASPKMQLPSFQSMFGKI